MLVGVGTLVTKRKLKCHTCGEYNDTGNAVPFTGPAGRTQYRAHWEQGQGIPPPQPPPAEREPPPPPAAIPPPPQPAAIAPPPPPKPRDVSPPGWHPDPYALAAMRWWNGHVWTGDVQGHSLSADQTVHLDGSRWVDVVGLQYYPAAFRTLTEHNPVGAVSFTATLVREPNNPHDRNAVAVFGEGDRIGYLQRDEAAGYRDALDALAPAAITAAAEVRAGHEGDDYRAVVVWMPELR